MVTIILLQCDEWVALCRIGNTDKSHRQWKINEIFSKKNRLIPIIIIIKNFGIIMLQRRYVQAVSWSRDTLLVPTERPSENYTDGRRTVWRKNFRRKSSTASPKRFPGTRVAWRRGRRAQTFAGNGESPLALLTQCRRKLLPGGRHADAVFRADNIFVLHT